MKRKCTAISESDPLTEPRPPPTVVEEAEEDDWPLNPPENEDYDLLMPQPPNWFMKLVLLLADLIYNCMALLFSPISSLFYLASDSYRRAEEAKERVELAVQKVPSNITHGSVLLIRKLGMGFLGAAYMGMVLIMLMVASVVVGVGLVRVWVDEPVLVRERLHFDYTDFQPKAMFPLCVVSGSDRGSSWVMLRKARRVGEIPVGHTFQVSVLLVMPDSDYNRLVGVFQLTAELLNGTGQTIAKSSRPCILLFRSLPVRVARTFLLGVPLLLGISTETQKVRVDILKHKEASAPRTNAIRVTLIPRAGTFSPPQLYEAEILINSQLPWPKKLIYNWKWTFYVWISLYTYVMLLLFLICCKPLVLSGPVVSFRDPHMVEEEGASTSTEEPKEHWNVGTGDGERDVAELLRKLRESRRRRRALLVAAEAAGSSADSSVSQTRGEMTTTATSGPAEDEAGDSESVC